MRKEFVMDARSNGTQAFSDGRGLRAPLSRRQALRATGALAMMAFLAACSQQASPPAATTRSSGSATPRAATGATTATPTAAPAPKPATSGSAPSGSVSWLMRSNPFENKWERETVIPGFQKEYPNVKVDLIVVPFAQVDPKLSAMIAGGTPPEIFSEFGASGFGDYFARGILKDLTPYFQGDNFDMNRFLPGIVDIYKRNGRMYHMPQVTNFGVMTFYNKNLFQAAGVKELPVSWDDASWNWDTMVEYAVKLTKNYGQGVNAQYGVNIAQFQNLWMSAYLWGDDPFLPDQYRTGLAQKTQIDHPNVVASAQAAADVIYKHKAAPTPADVQTLGALGDIFASGKIAISFGLPTQAYGNYKDAPFKWGIAPIPHKTADKVSLFNGCWFIEKDSKNPDAAWKVLTYLLTDESAKQMQEQTGFLVPLTSMLDPWINQFVPKTGMSADDLRTVITTANKVGVENTNHLFVDWPEISTTLTQGLDLLWTNKGTAEQAIKAVKPKVDAVVSKTFEKYHA
jgi:multiple sugar transport system substrate-binding protein